MTSLALQTGASSRPESIHVARVGAVASLSLLVVIGIELAVLAAMLPAAPPEDQDAAA